MAWVNDDKLNDPLLYKPRETPRVQSADDLNSATSDQASVADADYLLDDGEAWDDPLETLPQLASTISHRPYAGEIKSANPYARKRAPDKQLVAATAGAGFAYPNPGEGRPIVYASVIAACMLLLGFLCVMMMPQLFGFFWKDLDNFAFINGELLKYDKTLVDNYKQYRSYLRQDMIYQGVFVDGVDVGGLTIAQAEEKLNASENTTANAFSISVNIGNKSWVFDNTVIPATRNLDSVLQHAYAVGRQNTTGIIGSSMTPFRERVATLTDILEHPVNLKSTATYDHDVVKAKTEEIAAYVTRDPVNSEIQTFDPNTRTFTFTDEQAGVTIDASALYQQVTAKLDQGAIGEAITVTPAITTPAVTKTDMMNNFKLVSAFTTNTTSDKNRNNNINLACQAINGKALLPGETFSFNKTTGQRTTDKGYKSAGAIAAGQSIEEVGGGICQVSSTLFNAVARANLEIVSRSPHAWPSSYVKIGEDATVNWPNLDFQFKNNKKTPVFVIAYYNDRKCSAEIWGMSLGTGVTIDLESTIIKTIEPSADVKYVQNTSLAPGDSEETIKARTGYVVETYKIWYKDGKEAKRELMHTSTYKAYQRTIEYN